MHIGWHARSCLRSAAGFLLAALLACSGGAGEPPAPDTSPAQAIARDAPRQDTPLTGPAGPRSGAAAGAEPLTCPSPGEVPCEQVCCPGGSTCIDGACHVRVVVQGCPPEAPVACDAAPTCPGGCKALDASGRGNDLDLFAPAGFGEGRSASALYINRIIYGLPEQLVVGPGADLPQGDMTIEVWIRTGAFLSAGDWQAIYTHGERQVKVTPGAIEFCAISAATPAPITSGWHFLAATLEPTVARIYLDGVLLKSQSLSEPVPGYGAMPVWVGTFVNPTAGNSYYQFQGAIDELRVLDVARTPAEIAADFVLDRLPVIPGTRALWRFDEGAPRRCCPSGATCTEHGECTVPPGPTTCPATHPLACDGFCCPSGTSCGGGGVCLVEPASPSCNEDCGDGTFCASGETCTGTACLLPPRTAAAANPCGSGQLAVDGNDGQLRCCPDPGAGSTVAFAAAGECHGCYVVSGPAGWPTCTGGYAGCVSESKCIAAPSTALACTVDDTYCPGSTTDRPGGCCAGGGACLGDGLCCEGGTACEGVACAACGPAACCDPDRCDGGACTTPRCEPPSTYCAGRWCPPDATCTSGNCLTPSAPVNGCAGARCGDGCCAEGEYCIAPGICERAVEPPGACPPELPVACGGEIGCCGDGWACPALEGGVCIHVADKPGTTGPRGPTCGDATACAPGEVCAGAGCCPSDHPEACGPVCCLPGAACRAPGDCGCPGGRVPCGDVCCGSNMECVDGTCTAYCGLSRYADSCDTHCCAPGTSCAGGACLCPDEFPAECGDVCCREGACLGTQCGCPVSHPTSCGASCCAPGQACLQCEGESRPSCRDGPCPVSCPAGAHEQGGGCVCDTPSHSVQACPSGARKCCLNGMVCCPAMGLPEDCSPPAFCG